MYAEILENKIRALKESGQYREFISINKICGKYPLAWVNGQENEKPVTVWCSNDYLGMSQNSIVTEAMHEAIRKFGAGSGGSRNIGGTHHQYHLLESSLANWHHKESALVFPTGYASNDATLQCLLRLFPNCIVFSDAKNHASIINGIRSSKVECQVFAHNDVGHLKNLLAAQPYDRAKIIVFESIYSMDGDIAPIKELVNLAAKFNAFTFLDEVHAIGMYGPRGAGIAAKMGVSADIDIIQGTLAKSVGVIGGYIAASALIIDAVRSFASGFIFTTSLPPAIVAACYASIEYLKVSSFHRKMLHEKTRILRKSLADVKIHVMPESNTHILPVVVGDALKCKTAAKILLDKYYIYLQPITAPTVAAGTERFRINITPNHTIEQIKHLAYSLQEVFHDLKIISSVPKAELKCEKAG